MSENESEFMARAKQLRADTSRHYNCAQSVFIPFAEAKGMDTETAFAIADNFGAGMRVASVCGGITGALMALGLWGMNDPKMVTEYFRAIKSRHDGHTDCASLLAANAAKGLPKKPHCDAMVFENVEMVEEILKNAGKI